MCYNSDYRDFKNLPEDKRSPISKAVHNLDMGLFWDYLLDKARRKLLPVSSCKNTIEKINLARALLDDAGLREFARSHNMEQILDRHLDDLRVAIEQEKTTSQ